MTNSVYDKIFKSKKMAILTGAGISCNAGIPDFRSSNGLYNYNGKNNIKGKDLFDISLFQSEETTEIFAKFMAQLHVQSLEANPTITHKFIRDKINDNKVVRCYTQNIDGLESKLGLNLEFDKKDDQKRTLLQMWKQLDVVQLHGDLNKLSCTTCLQTVDWNRQYKRELTKGKLPSCPNCVEMQMIRTAIGKRCSTSIGMLRPNIVLYGENHPHSEIITTGLNSDLKSKIDLLLIFGTSLKVHGVKALVKSLAKQIHNRGGLVILINKEELNGWKGIIDDQIISDCDEFVKNYNDYEATKLKPKPKQLITPPSTPKKNNRVKDILVTPSSSHHSTPKGKNSIKSLLNTPSPTKKRKIDIFEDSNNELMTPQATPKKSKSCKNLKQLNSIIMRTPSIHRIKKIINE